MSTTANISIDKFRSGSQSAFSDLYDKYYEALFLFGQKYIANNEVVEDLVQEGFIKVWEKNLPFIMRHHSKPFYIKRFVIHV
jgi:Sigma-70 region 2.